ncbi:hypothetical protein GCM10028826_34860 [Mucilaginibacter boryungensis]
MDKNTHSLYADRILPIQLLSDIQLTYISSVLLIPQKVNNHLLAYMAANEELQKSCIIIDSNWRAYKRTYLTPQEALLVRQTDKVKQQTDHACADLGRILIQKDALALNKFIQKQATASKDPFLINLRQLMNLQVQVGREILKSNNAIYHITSKRSILLIAISLIIALFISFYIIRHIKGLIDNILNNSHQISESEEKYRSLFEQASDAIYVNNLKGDFTQVNESMCKMVGYSREELLTMNVRDLLNEELLQLNPLVYAYAEPGTSIKGERKFVHKNGTVIDIEINGKKFTDNRVLVIFRDISERKRMEAEFRNAEIKFRTLADKSMVGVYIVQNGKFIYVNPRFAEVFGYEPHELISTCPVEEIIHPLYRAIATENVRARLQNEKESVHYEAMGQKKDGNANWVEFYGSRAILEGEPTIVGTMVDITERKKAEEELRASEQKYKLLFESSPVPLWIVAKDDLRVIVANAAAARLFGYTQAELRQMDVRKLRQKSNWEKLLNNYREDITVAKDFGVIEHIKKDGTTIWVDVSAQDIIFEDRLVRLSSTNDVTEQLIAQEQLKKTEANLQTILNNTDTAYALLNADLDILEYNNKALTLAQREFNFDPQGKRKLFDSMTEERRAQFLDHIADVFKGNTISYEVNYPQAENKNCWYYIRMSPIADKDGKILGLVLAIDDITERKEAEQSLQLAYERIKEHIEFTKEIIWKQSHILRSPLANLKGLITILRADPSDKEVLSHIETEFERMDTVLKQMANDAAKR